MDESNLVNIESHQLYPGQLYYFEYDPPLGADDPNYDLAHPNLDINRRTGQFNHLIRGEANAVMGYSFDNIKFVNEPERPELPQIPNFEYNLAYGPLRIRGTIHKYRTFEGAGTRRKSRRNMRLKRRKSRRSKKTRNNRRSTRRRRSMRGG